LKHYINKLIVQLDESFLKFKELQVMSLILGRDTRICILIWEYPMSNKMKLGELI